MTAPTDRLFCPLTSEAFGWWKSGKKRIELRRGSPRWTRPRHVHPGRRVELRRGYSGPSLWGRIVHTWVGTLDELRGMRVDLEAAIPNGTTLDTFRRYGLDGVLVAFEVLLDPGQGVGG
jgi:hypothetical protein